MASVMTGTGGWLRNNSECLGLQTVNGTATMGITPSLETSIAVGMFVGLGLFAAGLAKSFNYIRKKVYKDKVRDSWHYFCENT